jgi:predicted RNA-binding Zn-ribbon protein involved in translation (DUF1610 family)
MNREEWHNCVDCIREIEFEDLGNALTCPVCGQEYIVESKRMNGKYYYYLQLIK